MVFGIWQLRSGLALLLMGAVVACQDGEFTGGSGRRAADATPVETKDPTDKDDTDKADKGDDDGADDADDAGDDSAGDPNPDPGTGGDTGNNGPSIIDLIKGLIGSGSDSVKPSQPDENTIDLGNNKYFHIGDNEMTATSCKAEVKLAALAGTQFFFEFEVLNNDTDVELDIQKVCGIDYDDSNDVRILRTSGTPVEIIKQTAKAGDRKIKVKGDNLAAGTYMIVVESQPNQAVNGDRDDYLVGNVKLTGNKALKAGKVGAQ